MCAAPAILAELGYLVDVKAICYPSKKWRDILTSNGAIIADLSCQWGEACEVVEDKNIITGLEYRSSLPFAIKFVNLVNKW
jgi:putative intracellular protease/amidase